ncbi:hypothetical protein IIC65_02475 [Candidatus Sumerlaeota bacterium]|nr:hypothetical protein [Candidatus Sumerlaeota bacterium]
MSAGETRLQPADRPSPIRIRDVASTRESIAFTLLVDEDLMARSTLDPIVFCVPDGKDLRVEVKSLRFGEETFLPPPDSPIFRRIGRSVRIKPLGVMRRWPLAAVRFSPAFLTLVRQAASLEGVGSGARSTQLGARIEIHWDGPLGRGRRPPFRAEVDADSIWGRVAANLVANPEGLRFFQLARPALRSDLDPQPLDHRSLAGGRVPWARLRVRHEGLHRLSMDSLARAGLRNRRGNDARPADIRLFYDGRPYPLLRRGSATDQSIYFWNDSNDSPYTRDRVYWVTLAPRLDDFEIASPDPRLSTAPSRPVSTTTRRAVLERDNEFIVSRGEFMVIEAMHWLDGPISFATPLELPLRFDHLAASPSPLEAKITFFIDPEAVTPRTNLRRRLTTILSRDDRALGTIDFRNALETEHSIQIDPAAVENGINHLTLALARRPQSRLEDVLWLDRIEVDYPSETRLVDGRLTLVQPRDSETPGARAPNEEPSEDAPGSVNRTTILPRADSPGAEALDADRLIALIVDENRETGDRAAMAHIIAGPEGPEVLWPAREGIRVEIYDPEAAEIADALEAVVFDDLIDENQGADYLIVAHRDFIEGIAPLAEHYRDDGLKVRVVDVQSVYDQFNGGELSPEALRDFFAYTLIAWKRGAPSAILLVGDCTSDYLGKTRNAIINWVPSYTRRSGDDEWASDEWMTMVAGDDVLADFMIGRISVNNAEDLEAIVAKQVAYATRGPFGVERARVALVADNDPGIPEILDSLDSARIPPAMETRRVYLSELPVEDNWYATDDVREFTYAREGRWMKVCGDGTEMIYDLFTTGTSVVTWFGHGSPNLWADERMWFGGDTPNSDNLHLAGSGHASFVVNLTCNSGAIDYPIPFVHVNIIEDMMRVRDGGAIAAFVPSGPGLPPIHEAMMNELFKTLFTDRSRRLGEIIALSKARYAIGGNPEDMNYMYILLGDPLQELQLTSDVRTFELPASGNSSGPRRYFSPGETITATLVDVEPSSGLYVVQLENERGDALWTSDRLPYDSGRIALKAELGEDLPLGPMTLRLYAWNERQRRDVVASAAFSLLYPEDDLTSATIEITEPGRARIRVGIANNGEIDSEGGRIEVALPGGPTQNRVVLQDQAYELKAGRSTELQFDIAGLNEAEPRALEVRMVRPGLPLDPELAASPTIRLWPAGPPPESEPARAGARLRIRPGSLRTLPESPTEGRTIFVHLEVENIGDEVSRATSIRLLDGAPSRRGRPVYNHMKEDRVAVGPLGPGRARHIALRWDPVDNAGQQTYWVHLGAGRNEPPLAEEDAVTSGSVRVRTKLKLGYENFEVKANQEDRQRRRFHLHVDVVNQGETDARNVSVVFHEGMAPLPENMIEDSERLLEVVPAGQSVHVQYEWYYGSAEALLDAEEILSVGVLVRLKGSQQRIVSSPRALGID